MSGLAVGRGRGLAVVKGSIKQVAPTLLGSSVGPCAKPSEGEGGAVLYR